MKNPYSRGMRYGFRLTIDNGWLTYDCGLRDDLRSMIYDNNLWFMTTRVMSYDFDLWRTTNGECFMVNN